MLMIPVTYNLMVRVSFRLSPVHVGPSYHVLKSYYVQILFWTLQLGIYTVGQVTWFLELNFSFVVAISDDK